MFKQRNTIMFFVMFFVLLFGFTQLSFGAVSSSRWQNQMYVTETEGSVHAFTATFYKVVDNSVSQSDIEKIDVSSVVTPVYSVKKDVGTDFATADQAIDAVKNKVFGTLQIQQILANVGGYAIQNKVKIIHIVFVYDCKINKRPKSVILFFNYKVSDNPKQFSHLITPPPTSGYLIADPSPIWVKISYTSRVLDSGLQTLKTYSNIYNSLNKAGILGRLEIDEMNLNGSVAKVLVNTQIKDNRFEMPQSGTYIPEEYITKIINAYKNTIMADSPIYVLADYINHPTIAVDKNGNAKLSVRVIKKEIDGRIVDSGSGRWYAIANINAYVACMNDPMYDNPGICADIALATCNWHSINPHYLNNSTLKPANKYNPPVSANWFYKTNVVYLKYRYGIYNGHNYIRHVCNAASDRVDRENCYAFYADKKVVRETASFKYNNILYIVAKIGGSVSNDGDSKLTATKFITTYNISYAIGGDLSRYLVSVPLVKIPLSSTRYYYAMQKILSAEVTYKDGVIGGSSYSVTKEHNIYIKNATKSKLNSEFYYKIIDPFKTNDIIDVRHDTVNGLSAKNYPGWNTPITYVFR